MKVITLKLRANVYLEDAVQNAIKLAREKRCLVRFNFSGVSLFATPKKSPVTIEWEYNHISSQKADARCMSAEYREKYGRGTDDLKAKQLALDDCLVNVLGVLDSGLDDVMVWLSDFIPLSQDGRLVYGRRNLAEAFERHGYKQNEFIDGAKDFYLVKENLGRYIVGQVIDCLKRGFPPHPRLIRHCGTYAGM